MKDGVAHNNSNNNDKDDEESLLTSKAYALALSPPRAPPVGTAQRALLLGQDPRQTRHYPWISLLHLHHPHDAHHHHRHYHHYRYQHHHPAFPPSQQRYEQTAQGWNGQVHSQHIKHETLRQRLQQRFFAVSHNDNISIRRNRNLGGEGSSSSSSPLRRLAQLPQHPHLPAGPEVGDQVTRFLGVLLPTAYQNAIRDSGTFRWICDFLVTATAPTLALSSPHLVLDFLELTGILHRVRYGDHERQVIDLFLPQQQHQQQQQSTISPPPPPARLIFFVHGGAWGSGWPWMYRLVATPFLKKGWAVAIVGYRTYPDATAAQQVTDLERAASCLAVEYPTILSDRYGVSEEETKINCLGNVTIMGHSSGAHISLLMVVMRAKERMHSRQQNVNLKEETQQQARERSDESNKGRDANGIRVSASNDPTKKWTDTLRFDSFVGLSGPYDISHHFDYEAARGVEELSPMKPACGYSRRAFSKVSPAAVLQDSLTDYSCSDSPNKAIHQYLPANIALVHGIEDDTVPFTSTADAARKLYSCGVTNIHEIYLPATGHQDAVMHFMVGGRTATAVLDWLSTRVSSIKERTKSNILSQLDSKTESTTNTVTQPKRQAQIWVHSKL